MSRGKILILDGDNLCHRAYHAMSNMQWQGKSVAAIFGFLQILMGVTGRYKPSKVYITWDGGRHKERLKLHPTYKLRERKLGFDSEDFNKQKGYIRKMMYCLGLPQLLKPHREADDYIYAIQERLLRKTNKKVIICSGDKDFRALVNKRVFIHDENKGLITPLNFNRLFQIQPEQYVDYLSLLGDKSDNIPGVPGYGEKTTLKFLDEFGTITHFLTTELDHKHYEKVYEATGLSKALIDLEWFNKYKIKEEITTSDYYMEERKPKRNIKRYIKLCQKKGIKKFATDNFINQIP